MTNSPELLAVILAAGKSTRMKSELPKVLHPICGRPMIDYVLDAVRAAGATRIVVVVGHKAELVREALAGQPGVEFALQEKQQGTGHAVMVCEPQLAGHHGPVLVLAGDTPLLQVDSLRGLLKQQAEHQAACVIGTAVTAANFGLGRVVRTPAGAFQKIVEQRDTTPEQALIQEVNTGCYAFDGQKLYHALKDIRPENDQGEYYLTDCPAVMLRAGDTVIASDELSIEEAMGVNTRVHLAEVAQIIQQRYLKQHMDDGVTFIHPQTNYVDCRVKIGRDTTIWPGACLVGAVTIGERCTIGPGAVLQHGAKIPDGTEVPANAVVKG